MPPPLSLSLSEDIKEKSSSTVGSLHPSSSHSQRPFVMTPQRRRGQLLLIHSSFDDRVNNGPSFRYADERVSFLLFLRRLCVIHQIFTFLSPNSHPSIHPYSASYVILQLIIHLHIICAVVFMALFLFQHSFYLSLSISELLIARRYQRNELKIEIFATNFNTS